MASDYQIATMENVSDRVACNQMLDRAVQAAIKYVGHELHVANQRWPDAQVYTEQVKAEIARRFTERLGRVSEAWSTYQG